MWILLAALLASTISTASFAQGADAQGGELTETDSEEVADEDDVEIGEDYDTDADVDLYRNIEEVVVTSQGRSQPLQDVAVSVAAFDSEYMEALGAQNITDIAQFTPNLEVRSVFSASNPTLFIRGVGLRDFNANSASAVAVYNDDVYMNSPAGQLAQLFDVQAVEVLRGPQGTLYGRNASAGAIRVIARKPTGTPGGYLRFTYGRFNQLEIDTAAEAAITPDLSVRLSGRWNKRDGTTLNRCADRQSWVGASRANLDAASRLPSISFTNCFNADSVGPILNPNPVLPGGGQGWFAGDTGPLGNLTGAQVLSPVSIGNSSRAQEPFGVEKWVNDRDNYALRGIMRWQPTTIDMDWSLNVHGGQNTGQSRQFQMIAYDENLVTGELEPQRSGQDASGYVDADNIVGKSPATGRNVYTLNPEDGDPFAGDYNRTGPELLDLAGTNLVGDMHFGDWTVRSITGFEWNQRLVDTNIDTNPFTALELELGNKAWQISQDVKTSWDAGGAFTFQGGLTFLYENLEVENTFRFARQFAIYQDYEQDTYYGSFFAFGTWEASEELSFEGGFRWNYEHKDFKISTASGNPALGGGGPNEATRAFSGIDVSENAPTGDFSVNYKPLSDVTLYLKYSRGWKGPHINGGTIGLQGEEREDILEPVKPESVNALEFGFKSLFFDDRYRFNWAAFYYDYENIQIFQIKNAAGGVPVQKLINANDADVYGVEIELEARPLAGWVPEDLEGLMVFVSFAWLEAKYTDFQDTQVNFIGSTAIPVTKDFSGNQMINAPKLAFTGFAQWELPVKDYGKLTPRIDWSFKDKVYFSPDNLDPVSQDPLWLVNIRLGYTTPNDAIEVAGWVKNVTDVSYRLDVINLSGLRGAILYAMGDPRTYGITISYRF
jgi:outer membrane receptor protein involved in Fe transport